MESWKLNKDIKDLLRYVGEHVVPVLDKKQDQTSRKLLSFLKPSMAGQELRRLKSVSMTNVNSEKTNMRRRVN